MAEEKKFPYTTVPNNLRKVLEKIPTIGAPPAATQKWLAGIGFSGGNNQSILPVLRYIGVIDRSGKPTEYWTALRSGDKATFADAVRKAYEELFTTYPDAHKQDNATLQTFVRTHTGLGEKAQSIAVRTFKVLTEFGDFDTPTEEKAKVEEAAEQKEEELALPASTRERAPIADGGNAGGRYAPPVALTVNLQIQLPPSAEGEVYDKLFAAMAKHLKGIITPTQ